MNHEADFAEIEQELAGLLTAAAGLPEGAPVPTEAAAALAGLRKRLGKLPPPRPPRPPAFLPVPNLGTSSHTPLVVVEKMLELAALTKDDVLFDLGSGDGRIAIVAAQKYQVEAVGIDLNPICVKTAEIKAKVKKQKVAFRHENALTADLSRATVITMHFSAEGNQQLRPRLQHLNAVRVVSYATDLGDWKPLKMATVVDAKNVSHTIYLWQSVPGRKEEAAARQGDADLEKEIWEDLEE